MEDFVKFSSDLDHLLPRYIRKQSSLNNGSNEESTISSLCLQPVKWLKDFYAIPGCESLSTIQVDNQGYKDLGLYPVDAASALAVLALGVSKDKDCKVLDLCCCPGSKFQMIAEKLNESSILVGVDLSKKRLEVCKSLLRNWLWSVGQTMPSQYVFECDGSKFGTSELGNLVFDSSIFLKELEFNKDRKKMNKSAKIREEKNLKQSLSDLTARHEKEKFLGNFDFVLVDAECTHDASYRHLKFFEGHGSKWSAEEEGDKKRKYVCISDNNTTNTDTSNNTATSEDCDNDSEKGMVLSHNIRDWKGCGEGKVQLQQTQRSLLWNGYQVLAPGGVLVYSTCSQDEGQNEEIIQWFLAEAQDASLEDPFAHLSCDVFAAVDYVDTAATTDKQKEDNELHSHLFDTSRSLPERSRAICAYMCCQQSLRACHGSLPLTV